MVKKVRKLICPVAGFGTRFLPVTKAQPKEMLPVVDKPVIQYIVEEAVASGIEQIIFITSQNKRPIEDHFDRSFELEYILEKKKKNELLKEIKHISEMVQFVYVRQKEALGLGHAVLYAKDLIGDEPFIVTGGDDIMAGKLPVMKQMIEVYNRFQNPVLNLMKIPNKKDICRYGVADILAAKEDNIFELKGMVEKPASDKAPSDLAIIGRWLLTPEIFDCLEQTQMDKGGEIQLTDGIQKLLEIKRIYGVQTDNTYYDCGQPFGLIKANIDFALQREDLQRELKDYLKSLKL